MILKVEKKYLKKREKSYYYQFHVSYLSILKRTNKSARNDDIILTMVTVDD